MAGLGLSACLQIVRQLDGQVAATNTPDGGAQIEIMLPVAPISFKAPPVLPGDKSILLIDDDDSWSKFARQALTAAGNTVTLAPDGKADLSTFDLIVIDNVLETANSSAMLRRVRKARAGQKTFVVASNLRVERTMELMNFGIRDALPKPYTLAALKNLLD